MTKKPATQLCVHPAFMSGTLPQAQGMQEMQETAIPSNPLYQPATGGDDMQPGRYALKANEVYLACPDDALYSATAAGGMRDNFAYSAATLPESMVSVPDAAFSSGLGGRSRPGMTATYNSTFRDRSTGPPAVLPQEQTYNSIEAAPTMPEWHGHVESDISHAVVAARESAAPPLPPKKTAGYIKTDAVLRSDHDRRQNNVAC